MPHRARTLLLVLPFLLALAAIADRTVGPALADPAADPPPVWFAEDGVAIGGYDPVAYFRDGQAAMGDPALALDWNGATWRFASAEHRALFEADPAQFAPAYGGFCAFAMAQGATAPVDPVDGWTIFGDRLYLNYSADVRNRWRRDMPGYIASADRHWPDVAAGFAP